MGKRKGSSLSPSARTAVSGRFIIDTVVWGLTQVALGWRVLVGWAWVTLGRDQILLVTWWRGLTSPKPDGVDFLLKRHILLGRKVGGARKSESDNRNNRNSTSCSDMGQHTFSGLQNLDFQDLLRVASTCTAVPGTPSLRFLFKIGTFLKSCSRASC